MPGPKNLDGKAGAATDLRRAVSQARDFLEAIQELLDEGQPALSHAHALAGAASRIVESSAQLEMYKFLERGSWRLPQKTEEE
jgi:HPt (histidine-containing phosphotransfer) domain-containing protein